MVTVNEQYRESQQRNECKIYAFFQITKNREFIASRSVLLEG